jgi:hypothetical protein
VTSVVPGPKDGDHALRDRVICLGTITALCQLKLFDGMPIPCRRGGLLTRTQPRSSHMGPMQVGHVPLAPRQTGDL